jgi:hypothetical protein
LVASLGGQIQMDLVGRIDFKDERMRSTFEAVPDAPASKFVLEMRGRRKGLLQNRRNLCKSTIALDGHNGKTHDTRPAVGNDCGGKAQGSASDPRAELPGSPPERLTRSAFEGWMDANP